MEYDIIADWMLNIYCNFSCEYCFLSTDNRKKNSAYIGHPNIKTISDFFDKSGLTWLIHMSGGEPFAHPRYIELCKMLTKKHYISINTNLTLNPIKDFIRVIDPQRVAFINCSLHYNERKRLHSGEIFVNNYNKLKMSGFNIFATQVFHPTITGEFKDIYNYFKARKIYIRPKAFRGLYKNRLYPSSYSTGERNMFHKYSNLSDNLERVSMYQIDPNLDRKFLDGDLSWKGNSCSAGQKFVWIKYNGDIVPCHASNLVLGNIFTGKFKRINTEKCSYGICPCPYYGLIYANGKPKVVRDNYFKQIKRTAQKIVKEIA